MRSAWIILMLVCGLANGQVSPFNQLPIERKDSSFSFIVTGHLHGASYNASGFPASTVLGNIDTLNSMRPEFAISLGDMFPQLNDQILRNYNKSLFQKIDFPIFNVVGNHDLGGGKYEKLFGRTFNFFRYQKLAFILLDTEVDDGSIKGDQLDFLKASLDSCKNGIEALFIYSHRPVWAEDEKRYEGLFQDNTRTMIGKNNYRSEVLPLLSGKNNYKVYWMSGSLGVAPVSFFYDDNPETGIINMQTAVRELQRDAVLLVSSGKQGVSLKGVSLTGQKLLPVESYNIDFWKKNRNPKKEFNLRMLPYMTLLMITHRYFWIGFASATFILLLGYYLIRSLTKRRV